MKKIITLLLALAMLLPCVAAVAEEPFKITIVSSFYSENEPIPEEKNALMKAVEETLNVDFDVTWVVSGDAETKFNTVMASIDQPMIYVVSSGVTTNVNYLDMCADGVFWDLTDYIQEYDIFRDELTTPAALAATAVDGRNYLFPFIRSAARLGILYRQDWMDALNAKGYNLEAPTTIESFKAMVEAFATGDPDGNGVNDTIGFAYCDDDNEELDYAGFNLLQAMTGGPVGWGENAEGKLMPYFYFDEYFETLELFKWMYENGYMNSDFAINTNKHAPLANNVSGSMATSATGAASADYDNLNNIVGEGNWKIVANQEFFTAEGVRVTSSTLTSGSLGGFLIPKYSVKTEAELRKILDVLAELKRADGKCNEVFCKGIEGIHFTMENGVFMQTDEQVDLYYAERNDWYSTFPARIQEPRYGMEVTTDRARLSEQILSKCVECEKYAVLDKSIGVMDSETQSLDLQIATMISDARVKYIMGRIDRAGFETIRTEWELAGGLEVIESVNAFYAK